MKKTKLHLLLALLVFPPTTWGEWKKHAVVQGKGSMNVAVASDFDKDGHIDAMTSFGYGVTVFKGPDWKSSRQVVRFKEAYEGKKGKSEAVAYMAAARRRRGWRPRLRGLQPNGLLAGMPGQTVRAGLDLPAHRRRDPRFSLPDNRGRGSRWQIGFDRQFGKTGGHPLPQFHRLAPSPPKAEVREHPGHAMYLRTKMLRAALITWGSETINRETAFRASPVEPRAGKSFPAANGSPCGNKAEMRRVFGKNESFRTSNRGPPTSFPAIWTGTASSITWHPGAWQGGPLVQGGSQFHQGRKVQPGLQADRDRSNHRPSALPRPRRHGSRR